MCLFCRGVVYHFLVEGYIDPASPDAAFSKARGFGPPGVAATNRWLAAALASGQGIYIGFCDGARAMTVRNFEGSVLGDIIIITMSFRLLRKMKVRRRDTVWPRDRHAS